MRDVWGKKPFLQAGLHPSFCLLCGDNTLEQQIYKKLRNLCNNSTGSLNCEACIDYEAPIPPP